MVALIGKGRMAETWLAHQVLLQHDVAVKVIDDSQDNRRSMRFEQEVRSIAQLDHPNILPVIDYGNAEGYLYLVMPYVGGGSLQEHLRRTSLSWGHSLNIVEQVLSGLAYAHRKGIVHGDLKPGNILMYPDNRAVLADFGLATTLNINEDISLTLTGTIIGSPEYMAPEQFLGQSGVGSDLYSVGVILYQLLTGQTPYTGGSAWELGMRHLNDPLPLPNELLTDGFADFFAKALRKRPNQRFSSADEMLNAFRRAAEQLNPAQLAFHPALADKSHKPELRPASTMPPVVAVPAEVAPVPVATAAPVVVEVRSVPNVGNSPKNEGNLALNASPRLVTATVGGTPLANAPLPHSGPMAVATAIPGASPAATSSVQARPHFLRPQTSTSLAPVHQPTPKPRVKKARRLSSRQILLWVLTLSGWLAALLLIVLLVMR